MGENNPRPWWLTTPAAFFLGIWGVPLLVIWLYLGIVLWSFIAENFFEFHFGLWLLGYFGVTMAPIMLVGYRIYRKYF
jgi:hypothetical protein